jgi:hypothetical protein
MRSMVIWFAFALFRLIVATGAAVLAARQRMWACAAFAALSAGLLGLVAFCAWHAGAAFRARVGDSTLRREASELPLLYLVLVVLEAAIALPIIHLA